jgi:hypothetical protein
MAQKNDPIEKKWEEKGRGYRYIRDQNYKGPKDWYGSSPSSMKNVDQSGNPLSGGGTSVSPDKLSQTREENGQGNGGDLPSDPKTQEAEPIDLPDIDPPDLPDIDPPDLPDIDPPTISQEVWRALLIIILAALVIFLIYWIIKNKKPSDKKVVQEVIDLEWNPEIITKTELELRLDEALNTKNYRECVRIYFTFILKELIRKNWIHWKKDKTNHDYLLEMTGKPNRHLFFEAVRIYDIIWYGEYEIDEAVYNQIQPMLKEYYKLLQEDK